MGNSFLDQVRDPDAPPPVRRTVRRETTFRPYASADGEGGSLRIGAVLSESLSLYRRMFPALIGLAVIVYLPGIYVYFMDGMKGTGLSVPSIIQILSTRGGSGFQWVLPEAVYLVFASVWCLDALRQTALSTKQKLIQGLKYLLPGLGVLMAYKVLLAISFVFLIVPGLMVATFSAVLIPALVSGDRRQGKRI